MSQSDFVTRGQTLVSSGQYQEAVKVCRLGLLGRPTSVEGRLVLGRALLALKRFDEVLAEMRIALELDPVSTSAELLKGEALLGKGDAAGALEVFAKLGRRSPAPPRLAELVAEASRAHGRPAPSASHSALGFVARNGASSSESTKHYPSRRADEEDTEGKGEPEDSVGNFTRPTSLAAPGSLKRSHRQQAMQAPEDHVPPSAVLAVGDGTVEVDPEAEGVELDEDDDFGALAAPPSARARPGLAEDPRAAGRSPVRGRTSGSELSFELESQELELIEVQDAAPRRRPGTAAVRDAVRLPSGPLGEVSSAATRPTEQAPSMAPFAQQLAALPPDPLPPGGLGAHARPGRPLAPAAHATAPTIAMSVAPPPAALDLPFAAGPLHAQVGAMAGAGLPGQGPDPRYGGRPGPVPGAFTERPRVGPEPQPWLAGAAPGTPMAADPRVAPGGAPSPARRARSRLQILMWVVIGALVIGGGVFAGFQIRAMRLRKQIAAARTQASELAKADTWHGWTGARDRLAGITRVAPTAANRAALARARAVLAYELGDGLAEAKAAVDKLGSSGGLDAAIAASYVALAQGDAAAAKAAVARASDLAPTDAAVLYVAGQAALLDGNYNTAIGYLRRAHEQDPRPLYALGLARAIAATGEWKDALAAVERALGAMPDHPAALIERAFLLAASSRIAASDPRTAEVRGQLVKLIDEGGRPAAAQTRGVSPAQLALAHLAMAQVDFALRDTAGALAAVKAAADVRADVQRFGEEAIETLYTLGQLARAAAAAEVALASWPHSRRARISQAQIKVALGLPSEALEILTAHPTAAALPRGLAVRGHARLALDDIEGARLDFDAALATLPALEHALIGRAWVALADGDVAQARQRIEPRFDPRAASVAMTTVYAAILRASGDATARETAKQLLEKLIAGPPGVDVPRAQLELARVYRELGDLRNARNMYAEAMRNGSAEARLESGLMQIEAGDITGGRDTFEQLVRDAGATPTPRLLLEAARARMLAGDHAGAAQLLTQAEQAAGVVAWHLDRERGRLLLRKGDHVGAAKALLQALERAGGDAETFLLAADVATLDAQQTALVERLKALVSERLAGRPEAQIVAGKLALAANDLPAAEAAYTAARKALENGTPRRLAQAAYGLGVIAYQKGDDPSAKLQLEVAMTGDPSLYGAYLYAADVASAKPAAALALARKAVTFNPDLVPGWHMVGTLGAKLGKPKDVAEAIKQLEQLAPGSPQLAELKAAR